MSDQFESRQPWALGVLTISALVVTHLVVLMVSARDPWHDEAQLAANLVAEKLNLLEAFPYYEQAAPIGYTAIARAALSVGLPIDKFQMLRTTSVIGFIIGLVTLGALMIRAFRLPDILMFGALVLSSSVLWRYATEIKQYGFEFTATSLLLFSGWGLSRSDKVAYHASFVVSAIVAALISFTAPIALASVAGGIIASRSRVLSKVFPSEFEGDYARPSLSLSLLVSLAIAFAVVVGMYVFVNRSLVYWQFHSFDFWYDRNRFSPNQPLIENGRVAMGLLAVMLDAFGFQALRSAVGHMTSNTKMVSGVTTVIAAVLFAIVILTALRRATFFVLTLIAFFCVALALNVTGKLPFLYSRHFLFIVPLMLVIVSVGTVEWMRSIGRRIPGPARATSLALVIALLLFTSIQGVHAAATKREQELTPLFAEIVKRDPNAPVWVYAGMQPAAILLAPPKVRLVGIFDMRSSKPSWIVRGGGMVHDIASDNPWQSSSAYPQSIVTAAAGERALWLIFGHDWMEASHNAYLEVAEKVIGPCRMAEIANSSTIYQTTLYYCAQKKAETSGG